MESTSDLAAVLQLTPEPPSGVVLSGRWTSNFTLAITLLVVDGGWASLPGAAVGALQVSILSSAGLRSANGQSQPSNATATVDQGTWGDAPIVYLTHKSSSALRVTVALPSRALPYPVDRVVVQWSTPAASPDGSSDGAFDAPQLTLPPSLTLQALAAQAQAWESTRATPLGGNTSSSPSISSAGVTPPYPGAVVVVAPSGVTEPLPSGAAVFLLALAPGESGSLVIALPSGLAPGFAVQVDIGPLTARVPYLVRAAVNNPSLGQGDRVGPVAGPATGPLFPLPPAIKALDVPSVTLPASGGQTLTLHGEGLGVDALDEVVVTLTNERGNAFRTARCAVVVPGTVCVCTSPVGVGVGLMAIVTVNGVSSDVFSPPGLAFTPPSIAALEGPGTRAFPTAPTHTCDFPPSPSLYL